MQKKLVERIRSKSCLSCSIFIQNMGQEKNFVSKENILVKKVKSQSSLFCYLFSL